MGKIVSIKFNVERNMMQVISEGKYKGAFCILTKEQRKLNYMKEIIYDAEIIARTMIPSGPILIIKIIAISSFEPVLSDTCVVYTEPSVMDSTTCLLVKKSFIQLDDFDIREIEQKITLPIVCKDFIQLSEHNFDISFSEILEEVLLSNIDDAIEYVKHKMSKFENGIEYTYSPKIYNNEMEAINSGYPYYKVRIGHYMGISQVVYKSYIEEDKQLKTNWYKIYMYLARQRSNIALYVKMFKENANDVNGILSNNPLEYIDRIGSIYDNISSYKPMFKRINNRDNNSKLMTYYIIK